jgi:hypothetical protein
LPAATTFGFRESEVVTNFEEVVFSFEQWLVPHHPVLDTAVVASWHIGKGLNVGIFEEEVVCFASMSDPQVS